MLLCWQRSSSQSYGFYSSHVWMWELDHKEGWAPNNWCFWTVVLEKTLVSPLDSKEIKPINPKGNFISGFSAFEQNSWLFISVKFEWIMSAFPLRLLQKPRKSDWELNAHAGIPTWPKPSLRQEHSLLLRSHTWLRT